MRRPVVIVVIAVAVTMVVGGLVLHDGGSHHPLRGVPPVTLALEPSPTSTTSTTGSTTTSTVPPTTTTLDVGALPPTRDRPNSSDPAFLARMALLVQAVATGDASVGLPAFFPRQAYVQVKAVRNPASDWKDRLVALYNADIVGLHASMGASASSIQFSGVDVPDAAAQWLGPGAEYNKLGYWRVFNTRVRYTGPSGSGSFIVISLISWRGQWYVVHFRTPPK
ncbi:MAG: hypothetical protein NVSMB16_03110 [Acidimicrobiales bacterium]